MNRIKVATNLAKYELRTGRGCGLIGMITDPLRDMLQGGVYLFAINGLSEKLLGYDWLGFQILYNAIQSIPLWIVIVVPLAKKAFEYFLGYKDEKIGYWPFKEEYISRKVNPYTIELLDRTKNTEKLVKIIEEKIDKNEKKS